MDKEEECNMLGFFSDGTGNTQWKVGIQVKKVENTYTSDFPSVTRQNKATRWSEGESSPLACKSKQGYTHLAARIPCEQHSKQGALTINYPSQFHFLCTLL